MPGGRGSQDLDRSARRARPGTTPTRPAAKQHIAENTQSLGFAGPFGTTRASARRMGGGRRGGGLSPGGRRRVSPLREFLSADLFAQIAEHFVADLSDHVPVLLLSHANQSGAWAWKDLRGTARKRFAENES